MGEWMRIQGNVPTEKRNISRKMGRILIHGHLFLSSVQLFPL